jgi:CheY-like chemotaxis protein
LSIAKQLAELLGGSIGVRSELGKGSSFTLTVPVRIDQQSPSRSANEHRERNVYNWANYVVLVAEDNQINYMILNKGLSQTKIQVLWAKNGLQACEMCAEKKPDIVLMDMQMPELDGYEATTRIKMLQPHLPIIAQTASALYEDRQRVLNAGCDDFIPKPIDIVHLLSKMEYLLKKTPPKGKAL